jgi:hypothetical protein
MNVLPAPVVSESKARLGFPVLSLRAIFSL